MTAFIFMESYLPLSRANIGMFRLIKSYQVQAERIRKEDKQDAGCNRYQQYQCDPFED
jgi:hypothetical protein